MTIYVNEKDNQIESVIVELENTGLFSYAISLLVVVDKIDEKFQYLDHSLDIDGKKYKRVEFNKKISKIVKKFCNHSLNNGIFGLKIICLNGKEFKYLDKDIPIVFELSSINVKQIENIIKIVPKEFRVQESLNDFVLPISKKLLFELNKKFPAKNPFIFEKSPGKCDFKGFEILSTNEKIIYKGNLYGFNKEITRMIKKEFYSEVYLWHLGDYKSFLNGKIYYFSFDDFENNDDFKKFLQKNKRNIKEAFIFIYCVGSFSFFELSNNIESILEELESDKPFVDVIVSRYNKILIYAKFND